MRAPSDDAACTNSKSLLDRMSARQRQAAQRLEEKRREAEQARLSEVKDKPDINERSRKLANRRTAGKDIATRGAQAQAAKEDKTQRMRAALEAREAAHIQAAPSINPVSRKMVKDGRSMDRMLAWEADKKAKLEAAREAAAAKEAAQLRSKVSMGQQSRRILSMKQQRSDSSASSRLYSLGVQRQQARREADEAPPARSSSAARARPRGNIYERGRAASAAREARLRSQREERQPINKAASAPRPRSRRPHTAQAASPNAQAHASSAESGSSEHLGALRSRLFHGRASSAPRATRGPPAGSEQTTSAYGAFGRRVGADAGRPATRAASPSRSSPQAQAAASGRGAPGHGVALAGGWFQYLDKASKKPYFFHAASNTVTWQRPASAAPPQPETVRPPAAAAASPRAQDSDWLQTAGGQFASRFAAVAASLVQT
mgnify:CR=1 FL=1